MLKDGVHTRLYMKTYNYDFFVTFFFPTPVLPLLLPPLLLLLGLEVLGFVVVPFDDVSVFGLVVVPGVVML